MKTIRLALTDNKDYRLVNIELPEKPSHNYDIAVWEGEIKRLVDSCPVVSDELTAKSLILGNLFESKDKELIPYKIYSIPGWKAEVKRKTLPLDAKGMKVCVTEKSLRNGNDFHQNTANQHLKIGEIYTVEKASIGGYHTDWFLKEIKARFNSGFLVHFNSVMFESAEFTAILSKSESEEKEEPKEKLYLKSPDDRVNIIVEAPVKVSDDIDPYGGLQPTQVKDVFSRSEVREEIRKALKAGRDYGQGNSHTTIDQYLKEQGF